MPETHLHVELISHTPLPEQVCALGAKLCYAKADVNALARAGIVPGSKRISGKNHAVRPYVRAGARLLYLCG